VHTVALLRSTPDDRLSGYPPFILTGFLLREGEPGTAAFGIPLMVRAVLETVKDVNAREPGAIRTIGVFEFELRFEGVTFADSARLLVESLERAAMEG
jgi:hypothetical protein